MNRQVGLYPYATVSCNLFQLHSGRAPSGTVQLTQALLQMLYICRYHCLNLCRNVENTVSNSDRSPSCRDYLGTVCKYVLKLRLDSKMVSCVKVCPVISTSILLDVPVARGADCEGLHLTLDGRVPKCFGAFAALFSTTTLILPFQLSLTVSDGRSSTFTFPFAELRVPCFPNYPLVCASSPQTTYISSFKELKMAPPMATEKVSAKADVESTQSLNPLDAGFSGPETTIVDVQGTGPLLTDPTDTSFTTSTATAPYQAVADDSLTQLASSLSTTSSRPTSLTTDDSHPGRLTHKVLVGVSAVLGVIICAAIAFILYIYWRRRHGSATRRDDSRAREERAASRFDGVLNKDHPDSDPFPARARRESRPLPAIPSEEKRGTQDTLRIIRCATDAGSVYVLDGESIYGDNGASVKGILPPAYEDLPSHARRYTRNERDLSQLPPIASRISTTSRQSILGPRAAGPGGTIFTGQR
ncbi:hypothetical protein C8Q74DRAFT_1301917 [Fomes fomentarius]|nr:hypothetical protein C8Q74DRAFT_1301917 [Fomes fomentarius]